MKDHSRMTASWRTAFLALFLWSQVISVALGIPSHQRKPASLVVSNHLSSEASRVNVLEAPIAEKRPLNRTFHVDNQTLVITDEYYWMRNRSDPAVYKVCSPSLTLKTGLHCHTNCITNCLKTLFSILGSLFFTCSNVPPPRQQIEMLLFASSSAFSPQNKIALLTKCNKCTFMLPKQHSKLILPQIVYRGRNKVCKCNDEETHRTDANIVPRDVPQVFSLASALLLFVWNKHFSSLVPSFSTETWRSCRLLPLP